MKKKSRIISASRRTDIPAFFSEWFINRVAAGYCQVKNPFNPNQIGRVELTPEAVDALVFWTRNPTPLLPFLPNLDERGFRYVFLMTVTGYPSVLEPGVPSLSEAISMVREVADRIGPEKIVWRYDPILIAGSLDLDWHRRNFARISRALKGHLDHAVISLIDFYRKTRRNLKIPEKKGWVPDEAPEEKSNFVQFLKDVQTISGDAKLPLRTCCEDAECFQQAGILPGACIDSDWLQRSLGLPFPQAEDSGQRPLCRCISSLDVGAGDSCRHGCVYCYATNDPAKARQRQHDPAGEML